MKERFYFTFGSASHFPFRNTYLVVYAKDYKEAAELFRKRYPDYTEGVLNCSSIYTQEKWDNLRMEIFYPEEPVKILQEIELTTDGLRRINSALRESRYFAREVRKYLHDIKKQRALTDEEKELWDKTHDIHIHTSDSELMIHESNLEIS